MRKAILIFFLIFTLVSCAHNRKILDSKAYFKQSIPGARLIAIDSDGKETARTPDTLHLLYLLLKSGDGIPQIDTVYNGNRMYHATIDSVPHNDTLVGKTRNGSQPVYLKSSNGNRWWVLWLTPLPKTGTAVGSGVFILKGRIRQKPFTLKIEQETELEPDIRM